ncbi:sigma-70 family RNA polymerase sigma factor [Microbulbifer spongiae]|uniref:Sigma-70 family RNA polymerase sigma factor n=1 Tax=Microbulbifer spongiae TaxID=2944933 RepID=A0ABY9EAQ5_9GAMM|nr:sigma-70 family RNA polymerase sigma factor [Microbulbifer sp. MI-G]WKD48599.1 sigma-70 family RNA polymerase sigma factor [Microbulbifer sp. MI-G]
MAQRYKLNRSETAVRDPQDRENDWSSLLTLVGTKRDRQAFERVFQHFAPLIKGFHHSRTTAHLNTEAGDELVQEVMLKVWHKAPRFDANRASASTWIYTIMRNCRIDMLRRSQRHRNRDDDIDVADIWDETLESQPLLSLQHKRNERDIAEGLKALPAEQGHILEKAYMEGKSHSEISAELKLPLGTVKSRVRLAMKKLQGRLSR